VEALSGAKATEEPDYRKFVQDTGFDYRLDLESVAVAFVEGNMYAVVRGVFHGSGFRSTQRLKVFVHAHGLQDAASQPERFIPFTPAEQCSRIAVSMRTMA